MHASVCAFVCVHVYVLVKSIWWWNAYQCFLLVCVSTVIRWTDVSDMGGEDRWKIHFWAPQQIIDRMSWLISQYLKNSQNFRSTVIMAISLPIKYSLYVPLPAYASKCWRLSIQYYFQLKCNRKYSWKIWWTQCAAHVADIHSKFDADLSTMKEFAAI